MANVSNGVNGDIPRGTDPKIESGILAKLRACNARNIDTLADVVLAGVKGEPLDDKNYLMEHIIQLTADLPHQDKISHTLTNNFLSELWNDLSHPADSYLGYDYAYRKADGSCNNKLWPHIGSSGQSYARSVRPRKMQPPRPDPGVVYDSVLERKEFRPHPNQISSVLFYVASIIIHDCFHTSHEDYAISETSSYLDLSPLYGSTQKDQDRMRTFKDGKLHPDCFSDTRIHGFPPGVGCMLIMFNRYHNMVVENLKKIDENGRFSSILKKDRNARRTGLIPKGEDPDTIDAEKLHDEALFQTGRLVTCGLYINIILQDYVRTILGLNRTNSLWNLDPRSDYDKAMFKHKIPAAQGNQVSAEFSLVYRWHSCVSERDTKWTTDVLFKALKPTDPKNPDWMQAAALWADNLIKTDPIKRDFEGLKRGQDSRFSDDDLAKIWQESVEDVAGAFGAAHVPKALKFVEILSMRQARNWNLASLNEFREYFKLAPHKTFESINSDPHIADQLRKLYGHPDNVEIYPGIVVEEAKKVMSPGSGLCASWTTSRAILADAVSLVRSDRFYTVDYTPNNLTNWGFQQAGYDLDINHGCVFYKLVLNAFPNNFTKNSIYAHYPLVNPGDLLNLKKGGNAAILNELGRARLFNFAKPTYGKSSVISSSKEEGTQTLVAAPTAVSASTWSDSKDVLAPPKSAAQAVSPPQLSFAKAVLEDPNLTAVTTKFYKTTIEKLWKERQYKLASFNQIDVVADVINPAHALFIKKVLGIPLSKDDESHGGLLSNLGHIFEHAFVVEHQPRGLSTAVGAFAHWLGGAIETALGLDEGEGELGRAAYAKLKKSNGADAKKTIWHDIIPTSALLLTVLSRSSAAAVEKSLKSPASLPNTIAVTDNNGQTAIVDLDKARNHADAAKLGPEIDLAHKIADISNEALLDIIKKANGFDRTPGQQGMIKPIIGAGGETKYLNETVSEFVPYPVTLKVKWN